jgi:hypothetical protein
MTHGTKRTKERSDLRYLQKDGDQKIPEKAFLTGRREYLLYLNDIGLGITN